MTWGLPVMRPWRLLWSTKKTKAAGWLNGLRFWLNDCTYIAFYFLPLQYNKSQPFNTTYVE